MAAVLFAPLLAAGCAEPQPDAALVSEWIDVGHRLADDPNTPDGPRLRALVAVTLYESYAADARSNLRSLAGQLNGLWSVPKPDGPVDGALVNAEAQRLALGALVPSEKEKSAIDSLATAHAARRDRAGVRGALRERSLAHGALLGKTILLHARREPRTLVLRHIGECSAVKAGQSAAISQAGNAGMDSTTLARADVLAEAFALDAIRAADAAASTGGPPHCFDARVRGRVTTR